MIFRLYRFILRLEESLLVFILLTTIIFAVTQIFLRNFFNSGIPWADSLVRILVLWLGLIGAMIASRNHRHIKIDLISRHLSAINQLRLQRFTDIISASVCIIVAWYAFKFVQLEYQYGIHAFGNFPVWLAELIIPFGFFVMSLRFLISAIMPAKLQAG